MLHPFARRLGELDAHDVEDRSWGHDGDIVDIATDSFSIEGGWGGARI